MENYINQNVELRKRLEDLELNNKTWTQCNQEELRKKLNFFIKL